MTATVAERLLDAARERLARDRWADVTMSAVAEQAGVSRQTLYKTFGSRDDLGRALLLREAEGFLHAVEIEIAAHPSDPERALRAAVGAFLEGAAQNALVRAIVVDEDPDLMPLVFTKGESVVSLAADRLTAAITSGWPGVNRADAVTLADALVRLAISYTALPARDGRDVAVELPRLVGPFVRQLVAG